MLCPFCGEDDFDNPGLANHIFVRCEKADLALQQFREEMSAFYERLRASNERRAAQASAENGK